MSDEPKAPPDRERSSGDDGNGDDEMLARLTASLTADGELLPTSEQEVLEAEIAGAEDIELPTHLVQFRDGPDDTAEGATEQAPESEVAARGNVLPFERRSAGWLTHGVALAIGAAAAASITLTVVSDEPPPDTPLQGDTATVPSVASSAPLTLVLDASCKACCAGCPKAPEPLRDCPSKRGCVPCDLTALHASRYRLRVGAVSPAEHGREVMGTYPQGQPELCMRAGMSAETCVPTHLDDRAGGEWTVLPTVVSGEDLAAKVVLRVRWKGVREPLATAARWIMPVALTPRSLCHGYSVQFRDEGKDAVFGTMSLFIDDAHYVELTRGARTDALYAYRARLTSEVPLQLQETSKRGDERFVLSAGPYDRPTAEKLRWQLLEQNETAVTTVGTDYIGTPKAID